MEKRRSKKGYNYEEFKEDELAVAEILTQLPQLILQRESRLLRFPLVSWGNKRRRSAINVSPSSSPNNVNRSKMDEIPSKLKMEAKTEADCSPLPPPPPSVLRFSHSATTKPIKEEVSSPETPLSFSPSESDYRSKHTKIKILKRKNPEEWKEVYTEITEQNLILQEQLKNVMNHYDNEKTRNNALRERQRQLELMYSNLSHGNQQQFGLGLRRGHQTTELPFRQVQQSFPYGVMRRQSLNPNFSSEGLVKIKHLNLNLNLSSEGMERQFSSNFCSNKHALTAQARKRRYEIYRGKKTSMKSGL